MSLSYGLYTISPDIVVVRVGGAVTGPDIVWLVQILLQDSAFCSCTRRVWDGRGITELQIDLHDVEQVRALAREQLLNPTGGAAIVVRSDDEVGAAHLFRTHIEGRQIEVFTEMYDALRWLRRMT